MTSIAAPHGHSGRYRQIAGAGATGVLAAVQWVAWFAWDNEYQTDPATGAASGPYEAWQVAGAALSLLVILLGALLARVHPVVASAGLTAGFTAAFAVTGAAQDETGLFVVGTVLVGAGLAAGSAVVCLVALGARRWWTGRRARP